MKIKNMVSYKWSLVIFLQMRFLLFLTILTKNIKQKRYFKSNTGSQNIVKINLNLTRNLVSEYNSNNSNTIVFSLPKSTLYESWPLDVFSPDKFVMPNLNSLVLNTGQISKFLIFLVSGKISCGNIKHPMDEKVQVWFKSLL